MGVDIDAMIATACSHEAPIPNRVVDVDQVIAGLTEQRSNWTDAHLTQAIASHIVGGSAGDVIDTIENLRNQTLANPEIVELAADTIDNTQPWDGQRRPSAGRPVWVAPTTVTYTTRTQLAREQAIVDWATTHTGVHRAIAAGIPNRLDGGQAATVNGLTQRPTSVASVVGPAGSGKTRMLRSAADAWHGAGIGVYGLAPTARAADELAHGAGIRADTIDKLLYEHAKPVGPDTDYQLRAGTVVVIDEAGMVDTAKLWSYSRIANANGWRTVLVGDHQQLGSVNAGGMFAELVHDPDVTTHTLTELHRFAAPWEADASLRLRDSDPTAVDDYDRNSRIHEHRDLDTAIERVAQHGVRLHTDGTDSLVLTHTRAVAQRLNTTITDTLLEHGHLNPASGFDIERHTFYPGQRVMARRNNRHLRPSPTSDEFVRNGDRFTVIGPHPLDGLNVATSDGEIVPIPASYVADGHLDIAYASTIHAAQGATVDETHTLSTPSMGADALYVAMTRGRHANHIHLAQPPFEPDQHHGPLRQRSEPWTARGAFVEICHNTHTTLDTAIDRRRQLRHANIDPTELERRRLAARDVAAATDRLNVDQAVEADQSAAPAASAPPTAGARPEQQTAALVEQARQRRADEQHRQKMLNTARAPLDLDRLPETTQIYIQTKRIDERVGSDSVDQQVAADLQQDRQPLTAHTYIHAHTGLVEYLASHNHMSVNDYIAYANDHLVPNLHSPSRADLAVDRLHSMEHTRNHDGPGLDL